MLEDIRSYLAVNQLMGDRLWNKLHNLETEIKNFKSQTILSASFSVDNNEDNEFMGLFPISSIEILNNCEYILKY